MARNCEALLTGKQQKMCNVMISQQRQESRMSYTLENHEVKKMASYLHFDVGSHGVLSHSRKLKNEHLLE